MNVSVASGGTGPAVGGLSAVAGDQRGGAVLQTPQAAGRYIGRMLLAEPLPQIKPLFIGSVRVDPPILQAPMAGFTNFAFRQIVREFGGAGLQATEMVIGPRVCLDGRARGGASRSAVGREGRSRGRWPCRCGTTTRRRWPRSASGWRASIGVSVVDINFGCPVQAGDREGPQRLVLAASFRIGSGDRRAGGRGLRARRP